MDSEHCEGCGGEAYNERPWTAGYPCRGMEPIGPIRNLYFQERGKVLAIIGMLQGMETRMPDPGTWRGPISQAERAYFAGWFAALERMRRVVGP